MTKRRAIISYEKLTIDQKKLILRDFPDGYINHLTTIKTPTGEALDAFIWETDEVIYLVKINKIIAKKPIEEEDELIEDEFDKMDVKIDDLEDEDDDDDDEEYDSEEDAYEEDQE